MARGNDMPSTPNDGATSEMFALSIAQIGRRGVVVPRHNPRVRRGKMSGSGV